jgi:hypothetical protein
VVEETNVIKILLYNKMSTNRLSYDPCSYKQSLSQSLAPIGFTLDPIMYEHDSKCRVDRGIVGGSTVSHIRGSQVDLENNLRGQSHPNTKCSQYKFTPQQGNILTSTEYIKPVVHPKIDTTLEHLDTCKMFDYAPVPQIPEMKFDRCG